MTLELAVSNTSDDIQFHHLKLEHILMKCPRKRCGYKWKTQILTILESPHCPNCHCKV